MKFKIIKEAPPERGKLTKLLKELATGDNCLVISVSEKGNASGAMSTLKRRNKLHFVSKTVGSDLKIWRIS